MEKTKTVASVPANYVSILQLQERWMKEKEKEVERGAKQQQVDDDGQGRREEEEEEGVMKPRVKLEEKGLRRHCDVNLREKESLEPKCVEKKELEGENGGDSKKKTQGGSMEEIVECGSKASPSENNLAKGENAVRDPIALETQFQDIWNKKRVEEERRDVKGHARLNNGQGYDRNQRHDWSSTRVIRATRPMVWVKKGKNDGAYENARLN